jgi:predicted RND superfamily exporter protein
MFEFILKNNKKILIFLLVVFAIIFTGISNFKLDASSDSLVLENDKDLLYYQNLRKNYASDDGLIISYQVANDLLGLQNLNNLNNFINDLKTIPAVKNITSILTVPLFSSPPLGITDLAGDGVSIEKGNADLELARIEFKNSPLYSNNLVSPDNQTTAILVDINTKNNTKDSAKTIIEIRKIIAKYQQNATIFLGGLPMITNDIIEYISSDLMIFSLIVIAVMAIVLLILFKNLRFMVLPLGVAILSATVMTGLLGIFGWKITVISSNFFSLLLVMTLSIMIHLVVRYRELAGDFSNNQELIKNTIKQMFKPCLYTTLTTLIAFISLLISGIRPVIDFGFMMGIGVILAFVLSFIIFLIVMSLLKKPIIKNVKTQTSATKIFANLVDKFPNLITIFASFLLLFSIYGITQITVENRFIDYFKSDTEIHLGLKHIDENLGGTIPVEIIFKEIGEDYFYDEGIRDDIAEVHKYLDSRVEIGKVLSIDTLMELLAGANGGERIGGFFLNIVKSQIPDTAKKYVWTPYINEDSGEIRIVARIKESANGLNRNDLLKSLQKDIEKLGFKKEDFQINGLMVLYNNMLQSLFDSQIKTISLVFAMIWLMFLVLFKSIKIATIAIIPNILPALLILGIMGAFGIPLDLMTITIAAIAIGIGVDNAIHYISRFKIEFSKSNDYKLAMFNAHNSIGLAMFYTSITVALGFLVLSFSNFVPSIYFGIFTSLAMFVAMLLNLTLLPMLLVWLKPKIQ